MRMCRSMKLSDYELEFESAPWSQTFWANCLCPLFNGESTLGQARAARFGRYFARSARLRCRVQLLRRRALGPRKVPTARSLRLYVLPSPLFNLVFP